MTAKSTADLWQLQMFRRSLKKQLKMNALLELIGNVDSQKCLLITCGDNNGAMNWYFRAHGGQWTWGDVMSENLNEMRNLLEDPVHYIPADQFPFSDAQFDCVVSIDVLEHLNNDKKFLLELHRVLRSGGKAIVTVPNGDPKLLANRIKWRIGMTPEVYGHVRAGYTVFDLQKSIEYAGFSLLAHGGYSRFFTEMVELIINYSYVFVLSPGEGKTKVGQITPTSSEDLKTHGVAYKLYSLAYPFMRAVSKLDSLLSDKNNNAVIVTAIKH